MSNRFPHGRWLLPVLAMAGGAAYLAFIFLPAQRTLAGLRGDLAAKQEFLAQAAALAPTIEATRREWDDTVRYNQQWLDAAPSADRISQLFGRINALAKQSGATLTRFDPEPVESYECLRRIPILVGCRGEFPQVCEFLQSLEHLPQTIWMDHLRFDLDRKDGATVDAEINVEIFADNLASSDQVIRSGSR